MSPHKRPSKKAAPVKGVPPAAHEYRSGLTLFHPHAAGIDVHSDMHMVCVPVESVSGGVANAGRGRTFSVNLETNVYQCFDAKCASQRDAIDLWASLNRMSLRDAALDPMRTFALEPAPTTGTSGAE